MQTSDFHFDLPPNLIAQFPMDARDSSRLFCIHRTSGRFEHRGFDEIPHLLPKECVLVINDSKVIPARLRARGLNQGRLFEILLLGSVGPLEWWAMVRPGKKAPVGAVLQLLKSDGRISGIQGTVTEINAEGHRRFRFEGADDLLRELPLLGEMPLPPYIRRPAGASEALDLERYQTVYAAHPGSVAAPTAGLHFTPGLLKSIESAGHQIARVTLHVGLGTFAPVKVERIEDHPMHLENYELPEPTVGILNEALDQNRPVIAVGTTSTRVLQSAPRDGRGRFTACRGSTRIFIHPPHLFPSVQGLITNFHLPRSTLLMLVSAFAAPGSLHGRELVLKAYQEAVRLNYRFFSYGDAMLLL